jgi:hypothetical protein
MSRQRFAVGPPWPSPLSAYDYLRTLGNPDWAWEFLRRNPLYQREQRLNRVASERPVRHSRGVVLTRTRRRSLRAEAWGLRSFIDPRHSALEAPLVWLPTVGQPSIVARADRNGLPAAADFRVDALPGLASIHVDAIGRQHVVLKSATRRVTIYIRGAPVAVAPARVTFEMTGLRALFASQRKVAALQDLFAQHSDAARGDEDWTITGTELRNALIALDANFAGASHRETATAIFGRDEVEAEWSGDGCDLKDYIRRARGRGVRLMLGGYRRLLR